MSKDKKSERKMKLHVGYSKGDNAILLSLYDGDEGAIIIIDEDQADALIGQIEAALKDFEKNNCKH